MNAPAIPFYALYGEQAAPQSNGFAHIETIASRSALHDWEIKPHRHADFVQVLLVKQGHVTIAFDGASHAHEGPCGVIVPAGTVHGFRFRQGTHGWVLTLSADFAQRASGPNDPLAASLATGGPLPLDATAARRVEWLAAEMLALQGEWRSADPLFLSLAETLVRAIAQNAAPAAAAAAPDQRLERFRQLVEVHYRQHRDLDFYAEALGLTRRTLSRLTAARLGCTPLDVIHRRLVLEARRLLRYTGASAQQVATELGFEDPSYFSRFYHRQTGHRPSAERA
jgi:AraC family transcriptional activator of pobA